MRKMVDGGLGDGDVEDPQLFEEWETLISRVEQPGATICEVLGIQPTKSISIPR
jgi:hypothetical protein